MAASWGQPKAGQRKILCLVGEGLTAEEIALLLEEEPSAVRKRIKLVLRDILRDLWRYGLAGGVKVW